MSLAVGFSGWTTSGVLDRSARAPHGAKRSSRRMAPAWMGLFYSLSACWKSALILCEGDPMYEAGRVQVLQHLRLDRLRHGSHWRGRMINLWDDKDGFFYDVLRHT